MGAYHKLNLLSSCRLDYIASYTSHWNRSNLEHTADTPMNLVTCGSFQIKWLQSISDDDVSMIRILVKLFYTENCVFFISTSVSLKLRFSTYVLAISRKIFSAKNFFLRRATRNDLSHRWLPNVRMRAIQTRFKVCQVDDTEKRGCFYQSCQAGNQLSLPANK